MSGRAIFEKTTASLSASKSRSGSVGAFARDFYYYNPELVSFFIINLSILIYFIYSSRNKIDFEVEVQSSRQILLHALLGDDPAVRDRINRAVTDQQADELYKELVPESPLSIEKLISIMSEENETKILDSTFQNWNNKIFSHYFMVAIIIVFVYFIFISFVWYYSYITQSTWVLFILMTANIFGILLVGDPFKENDRQLLPVLEALKGDNSHVRYLRINGKVLVDYNSGNAAPADVREEAINSMVSAINTSWQYNSIWLVAVANYVYRIWQLVDGLAPHITFYNKLQI